jgi:hypothetical protein
LVKVEQRNDSVSAELFTFGENDTASGPFELGTVIKPAILAKMEGAKQMDASVLVFAAHPAMTIDDRGLLHAVVAIQVETKPRGAMKWRCR